MAAPLPFALPATARQYAGVSAGLFVGIREFEDPDLPPVQFAVDDAIDLAHLFALELGLIDPSKTVVLLSGEPQKPESRRRLAALVTSGASRALPSIYWIFHFLFGLGQQTTEDGLMAVSFATHGLTDQGTALLAVAGTLRRRAVHTGLPLDLVLDDLSKSEAKRRLLIIDACRRSFDKSTRAPKDWPEPLGEVFSTALRKVQGCATLIGASHGGYSYDDDVRQNGVFTGALIDGLRGGAEGDPEALISLERLACYAQIQVRDWVLKNKPEHAQISLGISVTYDPDSMRQMPLALDPRKRLASLAIGKNGNISNLLHYVGIDDPLYVRIAEYLKVGLPPRLHLDLLQEIRDFDGSLRHRRAMNALLDEIEFDHEPLARLRIGSENATGLGNIGRSRSPFAAAGADCFGSWGLLQIGNAVQKMRWVEPGAFWMGGLRRVKPVNVIENLIMPRHKVTISEGFWLADTPCTQAFWKEFVGRNPSVFKSPERPVENVSWKRAQAFLEILESRLPGGKFQLPTEAQWEYACRAGTETETYIGDVEILGERNAPILDRISWYAGNSGHLYDLDLGVDSQPWKEKQYPHLKAGTRIICQKEPNAWGFYDMLGNIREWCRDSLDLTRLVPNGGERFDPLEEHGRYRITRGGSWLDEAGKIQAPARNFSEPGSAGFLTGFRILLT